MQRTGKHNALVGKVCYLSERIKEAVKMTILVHMLRYIIQILICQLSTRWLRIFSPRIAVLAFLLIAFCPSSLAAGIGGMFRPYLDYTVVADDNMLRIRDNLDANALLGTNKLSDVSQRFVGGVIFEKAISRQRLSADVNFGYTKFNRFSQINHNSRDLRGNWNWFVGNNFSGNMGASNVKAQAPFLFDPGVKNLRTEQTEFFNAAWRFHPSWRLHGDYTRYDLNSDSVIPRLRRINRKEDRFEAGLDYIAPSNSSIGIQLRTIRGDFSEPFLASDGTLTDNSYDQHEIKSKINWIMTAKSRLIFLGGWVERKNASFSERDFSGINARLSYNWQPTEKVGLMLNGWRETATAQNITASFSLNTGISAVPTWDLTEKIRIEGNFSYETRKFSGFTRFTDGSAVGTNNTFRTVSTKLTYMPYRGIEVSASAYHNDLASNSPLGDFSANGANINLRYIFGNP